MATLIVLDSVLPREWLPQQNWRVVDLPNLVDSPKELASGRPVHLHPWFEDVALPLLRGIQEESVLFLIEAHIQVTTHARATDYEGIEFLKHLRLTPLLAVRKGAEANQAKKHIGRSHAILHSWAPLSTMLDARPGNLIASSEGVSVVPTFRVRDLLANAKRTQELMKLRADIDSDRFAAAVRADFTPPESTHQTSNWWGVRQLTLGAAAIAGTKDQTVVPASVEQELQKLDNKKAFFLAGGAEFSVEGEHAKDDRVELTKLRKVFKHGPDGLQPPHIVYVDDEMDKGWGDAVYFVLTGEKLPKAGSPAWFHTSMGMLAQPENSREDWRNLAEMILGESPDLILTDLRLLGRLESSTAVKDTSGAKLVRFLREHAPAVPILLMTASNKAWTFQEAFRLGADAYWMKEGIGDHAVPSSSAANAAELVRLVRTLLAEDYQLLRKIYDRVGEFQRDWDVPQQPASPVGPKWTVWWREMTWPAPLPSLHGPEPDRTTIPDKDNAFYLLGNLVDMYREYLRLFTLRYGSSRLTGEGEKDEPETKEQREIRTQRKEETADFWLRSLVVQTGRIVECVHCIDDIRHDVNPALPAGQRPYQSGGTIGAHMDRDYSTGQRFVRRMRRDWVGQGLYDVRNVAAHYDRNTPSLAHGNIRSLLAALFAWLSTPPPTQDCGGGRWPDVQDFFSGSWRDETLVGHYRSLLGSEQLNLPTGVTNP